MNDTLRTAQRWSVTVQHRWEDTERVVAIALGGWDSVGPGLIQTVIRETLDPVAAVEAALETAQRLSLAVDVESTLTYGDWPDATAAETGYSAQELNGLALHWLALQPECESCGEFADLEQWWDWETGWEGNVCSQRCGERAIWDWMRNREEQL